jgi:hypothetical protein
MECQPFIKEKVEAAHGGGMIVYAIVCSLILFAQGLFDGGKQEFTNSINYAISVGIISAFLLLLLLVLESVQKFSKYLLTFLSVWWFFAVLFLTYTYQNDDKSFNKDMGQYSNAGNGFFATWGAFFLTFALAFEEWADGTVTGDGTEEGEAAAKAEAAETTDPRTYIAVIFLASFFEMYAAGTLCDRTNSCTDELGFALSVGVISCVATLVMLVLSFCGFGTDGFHKMLSIMLLTIWIFGTGVATLKKPFPYACSASLASGAANGYISCWVALIAAAAYVGASVDQLKNVAMPAESTLAVVTAASVVLALQGMVTGDDRDWPDALVCATIFGWISIAICVVTKFLPSFAKWFGVVLVILWGLSTAIFTFKYKGKEDSGVFASAGNGFFACWAGFFASAMLVSQEFMGTAEDATDGDASNMDSTAPGIDTKGMDDAAPAADVPAPPAAPAADDVPAKEDEAQNV